MIQIILAKAPLIVHIGRGWRIVIVFAIFISFPCTVEALQSGLVQKGFKHDFGLFMSNKNFVTKCLADYPIPRCNSSTQEKNLINESSTEGSSSLVKFSDLNSLKTSGSGQYMIKVSTNEKPDDTANGQGNGSVKCNHMRYFGLGVSVGGWLVIFVYDGIPLLPILFRKFLYTTSL